MTKRIADGVGGEMTVDSQCNIVSKYLEKSSDFRYGDLLFYVDDIKHPEKEVAKRLAELPAYMAAAHFSTPEEARRAVRFFGVVAETAGRRPQERRLKEGIRGVVVYGKTDIRVDDPETNDPPHVSSSNEFKHLFLKYTKDSVRLFVSFSQTPDSPLVADPALRMQVPEDCIFATLGFFLPSCDDGYNSTSSVFIHTR